MSLLLLLQTIIREYATVTLRKMETSKELSKWINSQLRTVKKYYDSFNSCRDDLKEAFATISENLKDFHQALKVLDMELSSLEDILQIPIFEAEHEEIIETLQICGIGSLYTAISSIFYGQQQNVSATDEFGQLRAVNSVISKALNVVTQVKSLLELNSIQLVCYNYCTIVCQIILNSLLNTSVLFKEFFTQYIGSSTLSPELLSTLSKQKVLQCFESAGQDEMVRTLFNFSYVLIEQEKREQFLKYPGNDEEIVSIELTKFYTARQRYNYIFKSFPTIDLLETYAVVCYKRAVYSKVDDYKKDDTPNKQSDVQNPDDLNSTDSISDDDSSSILGALFKEPPLNNKDSWKFLTELSLYQESSQSERRLDSTDVVENIINIFNVLTRLTENCSETCKSRKTRIDLLVYLIQEIKADQKKLQSLDSMCASMQNLNRVHNNVFKYIQTLLQNNFFDGVNQQYLLEKLNVSPWEEKPTWPLNISSHELSVLVQILQMKPLQEKEAGSLCVWHKLINTVIEIICSESLEAIDLVEDINVEHLHVLCYIFFSLNLMQKKSVLLLTTGALIRGAATMQKCQEISTIQILLFARLVMLLDFFMHYLYTAPPLLLKYVDWIVFKQNTNSELANALTCSFINNEESFYELCTYTESKNEKKLDGLAWNFILCTPEKLKYNLLLQALNEILDLPVGCVKNSSLNEQQISLRYTVCICWNLLFCLPPTIEQLKLEPDDGHTVFDALWKIRLIQPSTQVHYFVVNSLIKQVCVLLF